MISKISFKSTYIARLSVIGLDKLRRFRSFALMNSLNRNTFSVLAGESDLKFPFKFSSDCFLIVPNANDNQVEDFCRKRKIPVDKLSTEDLSVSKKILDKIEPPEHGKQIVFVNFKKLEKLAKKQCSNFAFCERKYNEMPNKNYLFSSSNIPFKTSTLHIKPTRAYKSYDELLEFLSTKKDSKNIEDETLFVYLSLESENQNHCVYFALRDLGLKYIPIYVDEDTYKIGHALKLFKEN